MLVLLDVDKTLIDRDYRYTDDRIRCVIRRVIAAGHMVGLNSDTALVGLMPYHAELGMNGPIIAERGALVYCPELRGAQTPGPSLSTEFFVYMRDRVVGELTKDGTVEAIFGNPSAIVRDRRYVLQGSAPILLVNALRRRSCHFTARRLVGDRYELDDELLERVVAAARACAVDYEGRLDWDVNHEYGVLIVHDSENTKSRGVRLVLDVYDLDACVMIGDSFADHLNLPEADQWAVANASLDYRARCSRVASRDHTGGVIELLESLL